MEQLNQYLQVLMSSAGYELHLEPNKNPYVISASGQSDLPPGPLLGTQISMMVFPLIPPDVKQDLPNLPTIQFVHPHNLGRFSFTLQKSPAGFNVTVKPLLGAPIASSPTSPAAPPATPSPVLSNHVDDANVFSVESSSAGREVNATLPLDVPVVSDLVIEDRESMPRLEVEVPKVEDVSANDPQFQTIFSVSSEY